jgi:hypothetical protein
MESALGDALSKRIKRLGSLVEATTSRVDYLQARLHLADDDDEPLASIGDDTQEDEPDGVRACSPLC